MSSMHAGHRGPAAQARGRAGRAARDGSFAAWAEGERPRLLGVAYLHTADPVRAARMVQGALAALYPRWTEQADPLLQVLQKLTSGGDPRLPWEAAPRFELIDAAPALPVGPPIVVDLARLTDHERVALVLERFAELPSVQIARVLQVPVDEVLVLARQARAALAAEHPDRSWDAALAAELANAIPYELRGPGQQGEDLANGQRLVRRKLGRRVGYSLVVVAAALVLVFAGFRFLPANQTPTAGPVAGGTPTPTRSAPPCDVTMPACEGQVLYAWRAAVAETARPYIDPAGRYFTGFGYSADPTGGLADIWSGREGALHLRIFRADGGATEILIEVATSRGAATRCGATTGQGCESFRFMDGNRFRLSDSTLLSPGIEVQHSPSGTEVVTVIARNVRPGAAAPVTRGDLVNLAQDARLHLPAR